MPDSGADVAVSLAPAVPAGGQAVRRVLYCVPGAWTDEWFDYPGAWASWCCAFFGWSAAGWHTFLARWQTSSDRRRQEVMAASGLYFFDWRRVPGGSIRGASRVAAALIAEDLRGYLPGVDVTLVGHSKGGSAIKWLLATTVWGEGKPPARAILIDAPLDGLREWAGRLAGLGVDPCRLDGRTCPIPLATINNWLDPSGGRLRGVRNYQTFIWQDYLQPYPPHGMKGFLAARVLRDLGALPATPVPIEASAPLAPLA